MMADFGSWEDWGLQAIVRGSTGHYCNTSSTAINGSRTGHHLDSCCGPCGHLGTPKDEHHDGNFMSFPNDLYETAAAMLTDELQELCQPFYMSTVSDSSPAEVLTPAGPIFTTPDSLSVCKEIMKEEPAEVQQEKVMVHMDQAPTAGTAALASTCVPKYKRRKNQLQQRVVLQSTEKDLSSDMWAWRKYGQKPIKGSPYPRSYYRCSSSKGCIARKQVEQSFTDPSTFIITYTADHNHSQPTRKNALAGTVRHKFSSTTKSPTRTCSSKTAKIRKPESSLLPELEEEYQGQDRSIEREIKNEDIIIDGQMVEMMRPDNINGDFVPAEDQVMFVHDDFFSGLCDWPDIISELGDGGHDHDHTSTAETVYSHEHSGLLL